ncbi:MAG: aminopeptidase [Theionarchaea archaeon]|nr:aminopeptidase [Theionarchaea archaeon]
MTDIYIKRMAETLIKYCTGVKKGDKVMIRSNTLAAPLIEEVYKEVLIQGGHPGLYLATANVPDIFFRYAQSHQLEYTPLFLKYYIENVDVIITIDADYNPKNLTNVNPEKIAAVQKARKVINETFMRRDGEGTLRWCLTVFPTHAMAQEASMSLMEYEDFVYGACFVKNRDPVAQWKKLSQTQEKIVTYLKDKSLLRIEGEDTELTASIEGRIWINSDAHRNFPSGEIFTGPVEDSVEGTIRFTYPGIYMGREIEDISLTFEKGIVVQASAKKGDDFLQEMLNVDEGARKVGEIGIGTNYGITKFTKNILFDEKIGGTLHLALGMSVPVTKGENISAIHWDILKDMKPGGRLYADGELFYEDGKFLI